MEQAQHRFAADPAARVTAPALRRGGPGSTAQGQRSRDRVLQASVDLIAEAGIDQVRVAEIARRAGMSPGQVMYYFTSKEHILLEALAWLEHEATRRRRAALRRIDGGWRQLARFVDLFLPASPVDPSWLLWPRPAGAGGDWPGPAVTVSRAGRAVGACRDPGIGAACGCVAGPGPSRGGPGRSGSTVGPRRSSV